MSNKKEPWVRLGGAEITGEDILFEIKMRDGSPSLRALALRRIFALRAQTEGLTIIEEEIQESVTEFFAEREIFGEEQMRLWLEHVSLSEKEIRQIVREQLLSERYQMKLASEKAIEERFIQNKPDYASACVQIMPCDTEGAAKEIMLAVREGEMEWHGGEKRILFRADAPEEIAASLFAGDSGDLHGPVENEDGEHEIWRLVERNEPVLDEKLKEKIRDAIVQEEAHKIFQKNPLEFLV